MKQFGQSLPKNQDDLIELCRQQDWHVSKTEKGHWRLVNARGQIVIASGTTSDTNSVLDLRARLKRLGLKPGKVKRQKAPPPEPKLVVDRSTKEETTVTIESTPHPVVAVAAAKPESNARRLPPMIFSVMSENDREMGLTAVEVALLIEKKFGPETTTAHAVASSMVYLATKGKLQRVSQGMYRMPRGSQEAIPVPAPTQDDDEATLIQFLVMLDKVGNIVKKHMELAKMLQKLGKTG